MGCYKVIGDTAFSGPHGYSMEIKAMKLSELEAAAYNPRVNLQPGSKEYESLKKSIHEFGYVLPIVVNKRNNRIIGGHQRINVLRGLGYTEIDCAVVDMDEDNERLLNLALNKIDNDWDYGKLAEILQGFSDVDIESTGFTMDEINDIECAPMDINDFMPSNGGAAAQEDNAASADEESQDVPCRVGEYKFGFTPLEWENISCDIRLKVGFAAKDFTGELIRRLLGDGDSGS